ncbi:hypothetical protein MKK84_00220 [Methylobacterium sp. E-065]|uniref:hypothetical protein n=1 Tax=Methylobacterium sp. E-065 TaxID=2836583 RepID=UPI001FBA8BE9|nr:hypothetical protein [Methylobacterium sp. E-065]MCJ2015865.1 hypothetical protein [Methylobacterium sp. E-065]
MLDFEKSWRFSSPGAAPRGVVNAFYEFIERIAQQKDDPKHIVEWFKAAFSGGSAGGSSTLSWAWSDLDKTMGQAADNAPLFIEAFWETCVGLEAKGIAVPDVVLINRVLAEHAAGYELRPPRLVATNDYAPVAVPHQMPSLAAQANALITESLDAADRLLVEGQGRRAVQELLWLLETASTAFRASGANDSSVQGKYFNKIMSEMRSQGRGTAQEQILTWMTTLHGFLSSPTGGGVRHGTDLQAGIAIQPHEARLYCNLIRGYLTYLIQEHERQAIAVAPTTL